MKEIGGFVNAKTTNPDAIEDILANIFTPAEEKKKDNKIMK